MKKLITLTCFGLAALLFTTLAVTQSSCQKNTTCDVNILVVDTTGTSGLQVPVVGATVYLAASGYKGPGQVTGTATTDNTGHAYLSFKLPAIFDITATGTVNGTKMTGTGLVQLNIGGTATSTVLIR